MKNSDAHFKVLIFWFIVGMTLLVFLYTFLITFLHIPKENIRFADTSQGFFLGTALGGGISFLIGGSLSYTSKKPETLIPPTKTEKLTVTTETTNAGEENANTTS